MPTNFTVVPVEARADGGQDEAAEQTEAPGPPEGAEPDCSNPGERGRTCPRDKGGGRAGPCGPWKHLYPTRGGAPGRQGGAGRPGLVGRLGPRSRPRVRLPGLEAAPASSPATSALLCSCALGQRAAGQKAGPSLVGTSAGRKGSRSWRAGGAPTGQSGAPTEGPACPRCFWNQDVFGTFTFSWGGGIPRPAAGHLGSSPLLLSSGWLGHPE
uniref:Uncharacterized protein n=1 Tax=Sus scrofa TaxID=9823 RepID=A0A8D1F1M8_PIG